MNFNEYQKQAHTFATCGDNPMYAALGLAEEAGEVAGKIAKYIRKHSGAEPIAGDISAKVSVRDFEDNVAFRDALQKELGDVLWMVAEIATTYGITLDATAENNIAKLTDRKERGVIVGEGDNR